MLCDMTHDELRDCIDKFDAAGMVNEPAVKALRAVVELHKPYDDGNKLICQECANLIDPWDENCYPCPTIQAIEKELE